LLVAALAHAFLLREAVRRAVPWLGGMAGYEIRIGSARAGFFQPVVLRDVEISDLNGTKLEISEATWRWANVGSFGISPRTWIGRLELHGVTGESFIAASPAGAQEPSRGAKSFAFTRPPWPAELELFSSDLKISGKLGSLDFRGLDLLLSENRTGHFRAREVVVLAKNHERKLADLSAVTAWQDGVAYFADLKLDEHVAIDALSLSLAGPPALTLRARACGGYVYADLSADEAGSTKAAVNILNFSLEEAASSAGLPDEMGGMVDLAKLTFNGDPAQPLSGQISLRLEAKDFSWQKNSVDTVALGFSVAGRRVRINECNLRQKGNDIDLRGTVSLPTEPDAWREAPFEFEIDADVGNLRALAALLAPPWNTFSGGLRIEGKGSGKASNGQGWLKVRGWDLTARGVPSASLQANLKLEGRDLKTAGFDLQSGSNFARGEGQITLDESLAYRGRLELRVRDVARYIEPLGRFAPDWAREGGVLLFWDGDGTPTTHSGVATVELVQFSGDLNSIPLNGKLSGSYSPGNIYISRVHLDRGPLSLSSSLYFGEKGLSVQDMQLFSGGSRLLRGEIFLPLSLEAVLDRKPWEETVMTDREIYAFVRSDDLDLGKLVELFGQQTSLRGKADLRLDASGPWEQAVLDGNFSVSGLKANFPSWRIPDARASLAVQVKDRRAKLAAQMHPDGSAASVLQADVPLMGKSGDDKWTLLDRSQPWNASLNIPPTELAGFSPKICGAVFSRGLVRGKLEAGNTLAAPTLQGTVEWKDGGLDLPGDWNAVDDIQAKAVFSGSKAVLEETRARMGEGTLGLAGSVDFANYRDPVWEVLLRGEKLLAYDSDALRLVCRPDFEARGNRETGEIKGAVALDGSSVPRSIALIPAPSIVASPAPHKPPTLPDAPFPLWKLDLKLSASAPLPVGRDGNKGAVTPDLYLQGTFSEPLLLGTIAVGGLRVSFPSRAAVALSGGIHYTAQKPWLPLLDLVGGGAAGAFDLRVGAFGPLEERRLLVSSKPALAPEQLLVMLTTGVSPVPVRGGEIAPPTPEAKLNADPAWLDMQKIRGLFGWGTEAETADATPQQWSLADEAISYDWNWK
jgi:hypothetical protein